MAETGDVDMAARMAAGLEMILSNDPEAYEAAMDRLRPLLGDVADTPAPDGEAPRPTADAADIAARWEPPPPDRDRLDEALLRSGASPGELAAHREAIKAYLSMTDNALHAMAAAVSSAGSAAGFQVIRYLNGYLEKGDDLIPDHHGLHGYLDASWLVLNTAFRLIESGALMVQQVPIDWQTVMTVDPLVRALIPAPALAALEQQMMNLLQMIAAEISGYQPWMTPTGTGYAPVMATGGSWEDHMASGLAELGISW